MAATKLIAMHQNKGRSVMRCLKDRTDYAMNGEKTDEGKYISSYQCNPELVDLEFAQAKKEYLSYSSDTPGFAYTLSPKISGLLPLVSRSSVYRFI